MGLLDRTDLLERCDELEKFRMKLWDKYLSIRSLRKTDVPFEWVWYDFLLNHLGTETPIELAYESTCNELEQKLGNIGGRKVNF
jgi:hypothetical protein